MTELLSVIVPIYNVSEYIERCVNSILAQTYDCIEIILVNDGSTDNSSNICNCLAKAHPNVHVVHKPNGGVATARNTGIQIATGNFVSFVDPDDYIPDTSTYEICMNYFDNNEVDVVQFPYQEFRPNDNGTKIIPDSIKTFTSKEEFIINCRAANHWKKGDITTSPCDKIYRKETFKDIRFIQMFLEDIYYNIDVFSYARKIIVQDKGLYAYCIRDNSSMTSSRTLKKSFDEIISLSHMYEFLINHSINTELQSQCFIWILSLINNLNLNYKHNLFKSSDYTLSIPDNFTGSFYDTLRYKLAKLIGLKNYVSVTTFIGKHILH